MAEGEFCLYFREEFEAVAVRFPLPSWWQKIMPGYRAITSTKELRVLEDFSQSLLSVLYAGSGVRQ